MSTGAATTSARIYFSDFFDIAPELVDEYGAFDVSLINDLPLFIDPFLLFNSPKSEYQRLHQEIIAYLRFLRAKSETGSIPAGLLRGWFQFPEVKQNWLGFSRIGNRGSALGPQFAQALFENLGSIFQTFGGETITRGSHLEKVCLVSRGIGRDNISDFTTNLILGYLLGYTQTFATDYLDQAQCGTFHVRKSRFNYATESWETGEYRLPVFGNDFVLLTPKDMLTRDETWISRADLWGNFEQITAALPDEVLRAQLNNFLYAALDGTEDLTEKEKEAQKQRAIEEAIRVHPEIIEYYIRSKEDEGDLATAISSEKVADTAEWFVNQVRTFVERHLAGSGFYEIEGDSLAAARRRLLFLKHVIEDKDGYRLFYHDGKPVQRESDLQLLYKFTWFASPYDVNSEVNNGRGPADFAISLGRADKSLVEFKLAKNAQLKKNLQNQTGIYETASDANGSLKAICYFSEAELARVTKILTALELINHPSIILIDARRDNKPSASTA